MDGHLRSAEALDGGPRERLHGVQYLRAAAALQVVLFHASMAAGYPITLGALGVPLFFVISGFIMEVISSPETRPTGFLRNRFLRIAPLYWLATCAAAALQGGAGKGHLAASFLFLPWPGAGAEKHLFPVHNVGWTLNYEMFFYGLFALSLIAPARLRLPVLTAAFLSFVLVGYLVPSAIGPARFWTDPLILQFLAGAWLGRWWKVRGSIAWPIGGCIVAIALLAMPGLHHFQSAVWRGVCAVAILLIVLAAERRGLLGKPLRPLVLLGDASYSIYLVHPLVILGVAALHPGAPMLAVAGIAASIVVGVLCYMSIERPMLRAFRLRTRVKGAPVPAGP